MTKRGNRFKDRTGECFITNEGCNVTIIEYKSALNVTVQYEDGTTLKNVFYSALKKGQVRKPVNRCGESYITNSGDKITIIKYYSSLNVSVVFEDGSIVNNLQYDNIKRGKVKNPFSKDLLNIGYLGNVENLVKDEVYNTLYIKWSNMIRRCYDEAELLKYPSYVNCSVDERWFCFKNFYDWGVTKYKPEYMKGWCLDKDILVKGNKIYSPETCCFVPVEINNLFLKSNSIRGELPIGVSKEGERFKAYIKIKGKRKTLARTKTVEEAFNIYKKAKESYVKSVINKWKELVDPQVYEAVYNYKVDIDD